MKNETTNGATIARTIILALALINQLLTSTGHSVIPIDDATVQTAVSIIFTIVMALVTWWKNNSFTKHAKLGDKVMKMHKESGYLPDEMKE